MGDMHYCGKCGACRPDCEVLRNQYVCLACCHDDIGWWQNRYRRPEPARDVAARLGASEHDAELPEPRFEDYELCQNCGTVGSDCPACDGTGKVYSSPYVERLRAALRDIENGACHTGPRNKCRYGECECEAEAAARALAPDDGSEEGEG